MRGAIDQRVTRKRGAFDNARAKSLLQYALATTEIDNASPSIEGFCSYTYGMRAVITGQVGMDKKPYLKAVQKLAGERGETLEVFHVGDLMYAEAAEVKPGRILDLPLSRLASLRRSAFKDIISQVSPVDQHPNVIVNTHATFRWRHGLFAAFDFDLLKRLQPDMFICMVDNVEVVHARLHADHAIFQRGV